jgi:pyruvate dehydrogenase E1 component alpha subunit
VLGSVPSAISESGTPFAIPGEQVDAIDVRRVRAAGRRAIERARSGDGPTVLEMLTYRYRGHGGMSTRAGSSAERRLDEADPVAKARARLLADGVLGERELKSLEKEVKDTVFAAAAAARSGPLPEARDLSSHIEA